MIVLSSQIRVFLYRRPTDVRKSFHGLVALRVGPETIRCRGGLFVFFNRRRDRVKIPLPMMDRAALVARLLANASGW
jgi:transposase